jgi:hypothetical protein
MRYLLISFFFLFSCLPPQEERPLIGTFEVIGTFDHQVVNAQTCGTPVSTTERIGIWIIEENNNQYTLTLQDSQGNQQLYATSDDGFTFHGLVSGDVFGCLVTISWIIELEYTKNGFSGIETDILTMFCASGSCSEIWDVTGTLID